MKLTNNSLGPKAITTTDRGVVVLQKGETADLNVSDEDAAAIERHQLLEAPESGHARSLADIHREIASAATPAAVLAGAGAAGEAGGLPGEDDAEVVALRDGNNATELQQIAEDESVDMAGARNKTEAAQRIVAKRRAAGGGAGGAATLPAADNADVVALVEGNDEAALRDIATDESVAVTADDDKTDIARKIVGARNAK